MGAQFKPGNLAFATKGNLPSQLKMTKIRHLGGQMLILWTGTAPGTGARGGMSGSAGGSFRGVEILVKLVNFGIGQQVLGIWNWAV